MNIDTGKIEMIGNSDAEQMRKKMERMVEIREDDFTKKQRETMQVSLKDHRSTLGKQLTEIRRVERANRPPRKKIFKWKR